MTAKTAKAKPAPSTRLHRIPEAAKLLGMGRTKVYELISDGELVAVPTSRKGSKRPGLRIPDSAIKQYIDSRPGVLDL